MSTLRFCLFGKFTVNCTQELLTEFHVQKVQELLCYLLLHRDRAHNRELLADLLWNNAETPYPKKYLRKTLWQLQRALDSIACTSSNCILSVDPQWIQIKKNSEIWLDTSIFEGTYASIRGKRGRDLSHQEYQNAQDAVNLYKGDLLEGWFQDWCIYNRERFREIYMVMIDKLMGYCEANDNYELGIEFGEMILGYDRARERTHQRIMRLHYLAGNRSAALRQFESCRNSLNEELGVEPSNSTMILVNQIANDNLQKEHESIVKANNSTSKSLMNHLHQRLRRLERLVEVQSALQENIINEIHEIERHLNQ